MYALSGSSRIEIRSLDEVEQPVVLESVSGTILLEFNLKPFRDRITLIGWTTITDAASWIVEDGFQMQFPADQWRRFKTEAYFPRLSSKNVQRGVLRAIREEDWFMDQEMPIPHKGSFKKYLDKAFADAGEYVKPVVTDTLGKTEIVVSPAKGATLREILYDLSIRHDFLWTLVPMGGVLFFKNGEVPPELTVQQFPININRARRTVNGWQVNDDQGYQAVYPGAVINHPQSRETMRFVRVTALAKGGAGSFMDYVFIKPEISPVTYDDLRVSLDSTTLAFETEKDRDVQYPGVNLLSMEIGKESTMLDGLLTGQYTRTTGNRLTGSTKIEDASLQRVEDLSPWATVDGHGMVFPRYILNSEMERDRVGQSLSVTMPLSKTTSARVGDVPHGIYNKDGRAFHLRFPEGYLFHELDNELGPKLYSFFPPGPKKDELIAEVDKYRGSAWKMKASSGIILTVGKEEKKPSSVPMDEDETFLALLRGGQAFLSVAGKDGPFGFIASNLDDSAGGGGSVTMHTGLDHSISIELEPNGESRISMSAKDLIADIERESNTKAEKSSFEVDTFDVLADKIYVSGDETYIHGGVGVGNKRTIAIKDGKVNIT